MPRRRKLVDRETVSRVAEPISPFD